MSVLPAQTITWTRNAGLALCLDQSLRPPWSCCRPLMICGQRKTWAVFCLKGTELAGLQAPHHLLTPAAARSLGNLSGLMGMVWGPGIHLSQRLQASRAVGLEVRPFGFHSCSASSSCVTDGKP